MKKKLEGNYIRMLRAIFNKSWRQHPKKQKTIQVRRIRHAGHCWRSKDELISDVRLWTPSHGRSKSGRQLEPTYNSSEAILDVPTGNDGRERRVRVRDIRADGMIWWCWWSFMYIIISRSSCIYFLKEPVRRVGFIYIILSIKYQ